MKNILIKFCYILVLSQLLLSCAKKEQPQYTCKVGNPFCGYDNFKELKKIQNGDNMTCVDNKGVSKCYKSKKN